MSFDEWWNEYGGDKWNRELARDAFEAGQLRSVARIEELKASLREVGQAPVKEPGDAVGEEETL